MIGNSSININIDIRSEDAKEVTCKLMDKICEGISWVSNRSWNKDLALKNYIDALQENEKLDETTKAVMIYNARKDLKRWANINKISMDAAKMISSNANITNINDEWASFFREKAENVVSPERQRMFSILLAQECNNPGSVPRALISAIEIAEDDAALDFNKLMSFYFRIDGQYKPLIIRGKLDYYMKYGLGVDNFNRLETIGLINMEPSVLGGIAQQCDDEDIIEYFDNRFMAKELNYDENQIPFGMVDLSYIGQALAQIIKPEKIDGFYEDIAMPYFKNPNEEIDSMFGKIE